MSTHPNAMLLLALTPDDLARKTYRAILEEAGVDGDHDIKIAGTDYHHGVMENDYEDNHQIDLPEGSIWLLDLVTYGYGEKVEWAALVKQQAELDEWARGVCERHHCSYKIYVSANYW